MKKYLSILFFLLATALNVSAEVITVWEGTSQATIRFTPESGGFLANYNKLVGSEEGQANLSAGDIIRFYYTGAAEGDQVWFQKLPNWDNIPSINPNTPTLVAGDGSYEININATAVADIKENGLILRRPDASSYTFTKVEVEKAPQDLALPAEDEIILWSGSDKTGSIDFRFDPYLSKVINANLQVKDTIKVYLSDVDEGDQIYIKECKDWSPLNSNMSLTVGQQIMKLPLTQDIITKILENKMIIQRSGGGKTYDYEIRYVTVARYVAPIVPGYEILYEGDPLYIDWASYSYNVPSEYLANLAVGDIIHAYTSPDNDHTVHKFAIWYVGWKNVVTDGNTTEDINGHQTLEVTDVIYDRFVNNSMTITGYYYYLNKAVLEHPNRFVSVTMNDDGLATFSHATEAVDVTWVDGLKAYTATLSGDKIVTEAVTEAVPANTGLILYGTPNATYRIPFAASANEVVGNVLQPTDGSAITGYVLAKDANLGVGFFKVTNKVVAAGKAYIPNLSGARKLSLDFLDEETTGINTMSVEPVMQGAAYNMMGQRVAANSKGLVIINGKKYINK